MPAHPKESNKDKVTSRRKSDFKARDFMSALYMKIQDGEGGERSGGGERESGREGEIIRRGGAVTRGHGDMERI